MNKDQIDQLIPEMARISRSGQYDITTIPRAQSAHLRALTDAATTKRCKDLIPLSSINVIRRHLGVKKKHSTAFRQRIRLAILFFVYAMLHHEDLPTGPRSEFQKKGVDSKLLQIRECVTELELLLSSLSATQMNVLTEASKLHAPADGIFAPRHDILDMYRNILLLRAASTLCTTPLEAGDGEDKDGLRIQALPGVKPTKKIKGVDPAELTDYVMFKRQDDDSNFAQLMLVTSRDDDESRHVPAGWLQGKTPVTGKLGVLVNPDKVRYELAEFVVGCMKDLPTELAFEPSEDWRPRMPRLNLVRHLDGIKAKFSDKGFNHTPYQELNADSKPHPQKAVQELLKLIYKFETVNGDPKEPDMGSADTLVSDAVNRRQKSDDVKGGFRLIKPTDLEFFYIRMLTQHLGYRVDN